MKTSATAVVSVSKLLRPTTHGAPLVVPVPSAEGGPIVWSTVVEVSNKLIVLSDAISDSSLRTGVVLGSSVVTIDELVCGVHISMVAGWLSVDVS